MSSLRARAVLHRSAAVSGPLRRRLSTWIRTSECSAEFANTCRRKDTTRPSGSRSRSIKTFNFTAGELMAPRALNAWISCSTSSSISAQAAAHTHAQLGPAPGGGDEIQVSADSQRLFAQKRQSEMARVCCVRVEAAAVVGYRQFHIGRPNLEGQLHLCGLGMFGNVA